MQEWLLRQGAHVFEAYQSLPLTTQWAVTLIVLLGLVVHLFTFNEHTVHDAPSLFTTAGIFFTFIGIADGLWGFDTKHIEETIPTLLEGLKTAFVASVFGVGIALSIKLRYAMFGARQEEIDTRHEDATMGDLVEQLSAVQKALVGGDDSTVLSQLKLTRQDTNDKLDQLNKSQEQFLRNAAENNSKALIDALRSVIKDFNEKISEQFGENFKQLNAAVGQLLEWQQHYRDQLSELIEQQTIAANNLSTSSESFNKVVQNATRFADVSESLSGLLTGLEQQRTQIADTFGALTQLLAKASDGLPKMEEKISQLTEQMTFGVRAHQEKLSDALTQAASQLDRSIKEGTDLVATTFSKGTERFDETLSHGASTLTDSATDVKRLMLEATQAANQTLNEHMSDLSRKTSEQISKLDTAFAKGTESFDNSLSRGTTALTESTADVRRLVLEATQAANQALNEHMSDLSRKTSEQVSKLDTALENELQRALSSLATQLTSLSRRFVEDYTPLTDRLRDLVTSLGRAS